MTRRLSGPSASGDSPSGRQERSFPSKARHQENGSRRSLREVELYLAQLRTLSETRSERIEAARARLAQGFKSSEIADALLGLRASLP
ncbi:MAG: hypothetical protein KatS3mg115_1568 [Candidatus Poribacteria bacterium]|nr:MAG: hypothetical protein KatS3mg115_1568 [Candidatus Poribacteria bacterium]